MSTSIQQQMVNIFLTCNALPTVKKNFPLRNSSQSQFLNEGLTVNPFLPPIPYLKNNHDYKITS